MGTVHPLVRQVVDAYLDAVDAEVPGLVEGLYLTGSVALEDFRVGASDIDFVAVTRGQPSGVEVAALRRTHGRLTAAHRRPLFDGTYVTWRDLARDPSLAPPGPHAHDGRFQWRRGACDPPTWHMLAHHGVAVRGPQRDQVEVWTDPVALRDWARQNLDDYWRRWWRRSCRLWSKPGLACMIAWGPVWGVLGISRLHYTLTTDAIVSKDGAGQYARRTFGDRWWRIVDECLRIRRGGHERPLYRNPFIRRREALDFVAMAIDDADRVE